MIFTKIRNLFGLTKYPTGKHFYYYLLALTQEERDEVFRATRIENILFSVAMGLCLCGFIYVIIKVIQ